MSGHTIPLGHNVRLVFNEHEQMDGDPRGWFLVVETESTMRPILRAVAPKRGARVAIPAYAIYITDETRRKILKALKNKR